MQSAGIVAQSELNLQLWTYFRKKIAKIKFDETPYSVGATLIHAETDRRTDGKADKTKVTQSLAAICASASKWMPHK
jgi:hypothetical protein